MATTWDNTTPTGRGPDFTLSNGNLTAAGKTETLAIAVDLDNKRIWGRVGGGAWSGSSGNPATNTGGNDITTVVSGSVFPAFSAFNATTSDQTTANFGATQFEGAIPSGFSAWGSSSMWDPSNKDASITLSNGNLTAAGTAGASAWKSVRATVGHTTGKWYFEASADAVDSSSGWAVGVENASGSLSNYIGSTANGLMYTAFPQTYTNGSTTTPTLTTAVGKYSAAWRTVRSTTKHINGKRYVEITADILDTSTGWLAGITNVNGALTNQLGSADGNNSVGFQADSTKQYWKNGGGTNNTLPTVLTATHVLCLAIDLDNNKFWGRVDGNSWSGASGNPSTNTGGLDIASVNDGIGVYIGFSAFDAASTFDQATLNTGGSAFLFVTPVGFAAWDAASFLSYPGPYLSQLRHRLIR